ncbi:hypothetical protein APLC1_3579 [Limnospira platensis C1]|nr:hypothetical protein APLC1_3579 [Arthrospira platensis C1]
MLLPGKQRSKLDETEDRLFYEYPRFVTHVDEGFIDRLRGYIAIAFQTIAECWT